MKKETKYEVRPVVGYEGLYSVSNTGQVFSHNYLHTGQTQEMKRTEDKKGYLSVTLSQDGKTKTHFVHRLVLQAFIDNPENKPECDHIDTTPSNNHVSNLRWVTHKENSNNPLTRKNMSNGQKGKTPSDETRRKLSNATKGKNNPSYDHTIYTFRNTNTSEVFVGTRYDFYTKYDLNQGSVSCLINGKLNHHKKWVRV